MKASTSVSKNQKSVLVIEFNCEIPIFPEPECGWQTRRPKKLILDRSFLLDSYAQSMAYENQGAFQIELTGNPAEIYFDFLNDLICVGGVIGVVAANRYEIFVAVGMHFDPRVVAKKIARQVQKHFYPDELLEMETQETLASGQKV